MRNEAQEKWDLLHTFSYSYICQPPRKYWDDEEFLFQRDILVEQVQHDVHKTDWKTIYARYSEFKPIQAAHKDAKAYYEAFEKGQTTPEYESIRAYAQRMDEERKIIRTSKKDDRPTDRLRRPK
jgi:uncharacterized protein YktA (UPF0223 family)